MFDAYAPRRDDVEEEAVQVPFETPQASRRRHKRRATSGESSAQEEGGRRRGYTALRMRASNHKD